MANLKKIAVIGGTGAQGMPVVKDRLKLVESLAPDLR